jgi:2-dehydro-3-deoxyphosphogluconate aldolase/(4S)-4-hydroxy-2-oxoglutarate aldolase
MTDLDALFGEHRVMVVLRGLPPGETVELARLAWDVGVELVEVPIGTPGQVPALAATVQAGAERGRTVGAGTVLTIGHVRAAAGAGARYTVAPGFDPDVLAASLAAGLPHLPGAATASEVQHARAAGCRWVKVFPAGVLGPDWFRAMRGPFPDAGFVATGGITAARAGEYLAAGAHMVALGAALTDPAQRNALADLIAITRRAAATRT